LGRELKPKETVHHIDKDGTNNNPENIMVFASHGDHIRFHHGNPCVEEIVYDGRRL
jgi:hypothetical protein